MRHKIKFKNDEPKLIWIDKKRSPKNSTELVLKDGSKVYISDTNDYNHAVERICLYSEFNAGKYENSNKYISALIEILDEEDAGNFFLFLEELKDWHKHIEINHKEEYE